jgi:hypothetical protein
LLYTIIAVVLVVAVSGAGCTAFMWRRRQHNGVARAHHYERYGANTVSMFMNPLHSGVDGGGTTVDYDEPVDTAGAVKLDSELYVAGGGAAASKASQSAHYDTVEPSTLADAKGANRKSTQAPVHRPEGAYETVLGGASAYQLSHGARIARHDRSKGERANRGDGVCEADASAYEVFQSSGVDRSRRSNVETSA